MVTHCSIHYAIVTLDIMFRNVSASLFRLAVLTMVSNKRLHYAFYLDNTHMFVFRVFIDVMKI